MIGTPQLRTGKIENLNNVNSGNNHSEKTFLSI